MTWTKKYRWSRTWGAETGLNGLPHEDYCGWDGDIRIGRIYLDAQSLKAGQWRWAIQYPKGAPPMMPNCGWASSAADAAKIIEDCWDAQTQAMASANRRDEP